MPDPGFLGLCPNPSNLPRITCVPPTVTIKDYTYSSVSPIRSPYNTGDALVLATLAEMLLLPIAGYIWQKLSSKAPC